MADVAGQLVAGLLHGELLVHLPPVGVIHRVHDGKQVQGLGDPPVLSERLTERRGAALVAEHPQQVIGAHLIGDQGAGHPQHVRSGNKAGGAFCDHVVHAPTFTRGGPALILSLTVVALQGFVIVPSLWRPSMFRSTAFLPRGRCAPSSGP